jgi:hypothetical protein
VRYSKARLDTVAAINDRSLKVKNENNRGHRSRLQGNLGMHKTDVNDVGYRKQIVQETPLLQ